MFMPRKKSVANSRRQQEEEHSSGDEVLSCRKALLDEEMKEQLNELSDVKQRLKLDCKQLGIMNPQRAF